MHSNCLIILSNWKYADLWHILIENYDRYNFFNDNFDIFITTDSINGFEDLESSSSFKFIVYPSNLSWLEALKFTVDNLVLKKYRFTLFTFDDLFITEVKTEQIEDILSRNFFYYKLLDTHVNIYNKCECRNGELILTNVQDSYIGSLVFTIFRTEFIHKVLQKMPDNLNPWEYEYHASKYFRERLGFFCAQKSVISYQNLIIKGKLNPISRKNIETLIGRKVVLKRKVMNFCEVARYILKYYLWTAFRRVTPFSIQKYFRRKY
ncbi:MAG: hypothetical protein HQ490_08065 [Lutibacter sp.]|nr:hypothetical protein [Lutibacter sp.]